MDHEIRKARARERQVALALAQAMLPRVRPPHRPDTAIRYLPAVGLLNVCGDWYELVDLADDRVAVAVGDVVGHGLEAACVMGQLRSALGAAIRTVDGPAQALEALGGYARRVEGAMSTTVVQAVIDRAACAIDYSCAGHLPPVLLSPDGDVEFLDQATDPPLGAWPEQRPFPQAGLTYKVGSTLALYTDGLIERRGEDIDNGLDRLTGSLLDHRRLHPERLADAVLTDLGVSGGGADDIALIVIRL